MTKSPAVHNQFTSRLTDITQAVEQAIESYLAHDPGVPDTLHDAMLYSLHAGGKRLRPIMVVLACEACHGERIDALPAAAAIELIHTYSLIHDDLPAMDDDDLRRGRPTNHKVFGEGVAILAGDALLTYAFHILARHVRKDSLIRELVMELSYAAGAPGMIGGQAADLLNEYTPGDLDTVNYIHTHKTAMMFSTACRMGALCADADHCHIDMLGDFGLKIGLAFQIIDDMLDITATDKQMGKRTGKDRSAGKLTYPAIAGLESSRRRATELLDEAIAKIAELKETAEPLRFLARNLTERKN